MANAIGPIDKIGDLVTQDPHRAHLFGQLSLDYCCGGQRTLTDACAEHGLDVATVIALLRGQQYSPDPAGAHDVAPALITELCDHVVAAHHQRLRRDLPRIDELLTKVVRAHEEGHHELNDLQRRFAGMRSILEDHLVVEEEDAFCGTHRVLLHSLQDLELDLHQHVHEENNVLFPHVRGRLAAARERADPQAMGTAVQ